MKIFDGKAHAAAIDKYLKIKLDKIKPVGKLLIVLIGDNPASLTYIGVKMRLCESLGIPVKFEHLNENLADQEIFAKVKSCFEDTDVRSGIVQFPLPRESLKKVLNIIPPEKDADLISNTNMTRYYAGELNGLTPVVRATSYFLLNALVGELAGNDSYIDLARTTPLLKEKLQNKKVHIIGNGFLVGKPIRYFLNSLNASTNNDEIYQTGDKIYSDFLILGAGSPNLIKGEDVSEGCNVLDFGITVVDGKVVGDFDKNSKTDHLGLLSLAPGGIGPVVVRFLLLNWLESQVFS